MKIDENAPPAANALDLLGDLGAQIGVMHAALMALIETHPSRNAAKAVFVQKIKAQENIEQKDAAAHAIPEGIARLQRTRKQIYSNRWLAVFEGHGSQT